MSLLSSPKLQNKFISAYSSSNTARGKMLSTVLTQNLASIESIDIGDNAIANSTQTTRAIFSSIGIDIHNDENLEND